MEAKINNVHATWLPLSILDRFAEMAELLLVSVLQSYPDMSWMLNVQLLKLPIVALAKKPGPIWIGSHWSGTGTVDVSVRVETWLLLERLSARDIHRWCSPEAACRNRDFLNFDDHLTVPQNVLRHPHQGDGRCTFYVPSSWWLCLVCLHFSRSWKEICQSRFFFPRALNMYHTLSPGFLWCFTAK